MIVSVDVTKKGQIFNPYYIKCITAGRAAEGLRASWQKQLKELQSDIGFEYIRFHGIFHDDMAIYSEDKDGNSKFFWQYFDELFDFLQEVNLRPIFELGFVPTVLATKPNTVFWWHANGCPPTNYEKWALLVSETVKHSIERYGIDEVRKWYFEVWNEPNLRSFWSGTQEEYFKLYKYSVDAIKNIDTQLKVGGPSTSGADFRESETHLPYFEAFIDYCYKNNLPIDFFTAHPYPTYWPLDEAGNQQMGYMDKDSTIKHLNLIRKIVDRSPYKNAEIHLTEWSSSPSPRDLIHDTPFMAPFILYNCTQCIGLVSSLAFWDFTDIFEENGPGESLFHGGFGLINVQGIKKPSYHAYKFLSQLGNELLYNDENCIVTRSNDNYQILLWNFCYYKDNFARGDRSSLSLHNRDEVFRDKKLDLKICISNLQGRFKEHVFKLGKEYGSALHNWYDMGAPESPTKAQINLLKENSVPTNISTIEKNIINDYTKSFSLEPHDAVLVTLRKV
jgi:Beta-xylosidase